MQLRNNILRNKDEVDSFLDAPLDLVVHPFGFAGHYLELVIRDVFKDVKEIYFARFESFLLCWFLPKKEISISKWLPSLVPSHGQDEPLGVTLDLHWHLLQKF